MMVGKQGYRKILKQGTALLAIGMAGLFAVNPAHANCSNSTPGAGDMVSCGPGAPNPDPVGVYDPLQSIPNLPVDVTVDVLDSAIISGIYLGRDATIRTEAGSRIDGSLRPGVNRVIHVESGMLDLAGEIVNAAAGIQIGTSAASPGGSSLVLREPGSIASGGGSAAILMQSNMGRLQIDGAITSSGSNTVPAGSVVSLGNDMTTIVGATGSVTTTGDFMSTIVSVGNGNMVQLAGSVATAGEFAAGITITPGLVNNFSNSIELLAGSSITTTGDNAPAIFTVATGTDNSFAISLTDSMIETSGNGSNAIFADANQVELVLNTGSVLNTSGDQSDIIRLGGAGGPAQITATLVGTVLNSEGNESRGIVIEPLADRSNLFLVLQNTVSGTNGSGLLVSQLGSATTAEFTIDGSIISTTEPSSSGGDIAAIGEGSALTFNMSRTDIITATGFGANSPVVGDGAAVRIGGISGANSALNVNLADSGLSAGPNGSPAFEIASFIQDRSTGVLTIGRSNFSTLGDDAGAIIVGSAMAGPMDDTSQTINITDSTVSTAGDRSGGIFVNSNLDGATNSDFGILVSGVEISTLGEDSHALQIIGAQNVQAGDLDNPTPNPTNGDVFSSVTIGASEDITAAGANSDAINITNQGRSVILANNDATISGGTGDAVAIRLLGAEANSAAVDEITGQASVAKAKIADNAANIVTGYSADNTATFDPITIDMFDASDFSQLIGVDNAIVESMMGAGAITSSGSLAIEAMNGAIIRSGNDDAPVISAAEAVAIIASDTTFSSMGDNAPLFHIAEMNMGDGTAFYGEFTNITATTTGANSDAIATGGGVADSVAALFLRANDPMAPNMISTSGDGSSAISFNGPGGGTFTGSIADSNISTSGTDAAAILLNMGSTSSASLELLDTLVSTTGNGSDVVRLNTGDDTDYNFIIADSELRSEGDDSALLRVSGRGTTNIGNFVMIGGTLSSAGDNSGGIIVEGDQAIGASSHTFFFGESSVSTEGDNSGGLVFERIGDPAGGSSAATFTLDATDISTSGENSDAFFTGSLFGNSVKGVTITNSSFVTAGDNSRAMVTEALGDISVQTVTVGDTRYDISGNNSSAIIVNAIPEGIPDLDSDGSIFSFDIARSTVGTTGDNSRGIDVATLAGDNSTTIISMDDNRITTAGVNSDAISIGMQAAMGPLGSSHTTSISSLEIATTGADSRGIFINAFSDGIVADDLNMDGRFQGDATIAIAENSIATSGARSHGIEFAATTGDFVDAILDIEISGNSISTEGDGAIGFLLGNFSGALTDDRGSNGDNAFSFNFNTTDVTTMGANAHAISLGNFLPTIPFEFSDINLMTAGAASHGINLASGLSDSTTAITISASDPMARNVIRTSGNGSNAINFEGNLASAHTANVSGTDIITEGDNAAGFVFERITGNGINDTGASIGSFALDDVQISTSGANSNAFFSGSLLAGSVKDAIIVNSSFRTSGDNSRAYIAEALGQGSSTSLAIGNSTFNTRGADSAAITFNEGSVFNVIGAADSSISSFDIGSSMISTLGNNSRGIDVATVAGDRSTTVITINDNRITTEGANSDAISIGTQVAIGRDGASHTVSIDLSTITTSGDDSRGIYVGSLTDGLVGVDASNGGVTNATFFTGDNMIITSGARSHGMEYAAIAGDLEDGIVDIAEAGSTIQTRGDNAVAMLFGGVEGSFIDGAGTAGGPQLSITWVPSSLTTEGGGAHGMQIGDLPAFDMADNADVTLTIVAREITTTGDGAHGVVIGSGWGEANSTRDANRTGANRTTILTVDGAINASGAGSHGIVSNSTFLELSVAETGSITSANGFALKFDEVDDGFTATNFGTITGNVIFGGGDDVFDSSGTFTGNIDMGGGANAIFVRAGGVFNSLDYILLGDGNAITVEGDISPGGIGPIQLTQIGSDLIFETGSRLLIDIDGMATDPSAMGFFQSDRISVNGNIVINGGTLAVESLTPEVDFNRQAQFLILDAAGSVTGEFSDLMADLPFLDLNLTYNTSNVILNASRQGPVVPFASLGLTPNQRAVGASFDTLEPGATGDLDAVIDELIFASTPQALTAFDSTSGEIYASLLAQAGNDGLRRSREILARARRTSGSGWGIWGGVGYSDSSIDGDGNGASVNQDDFGFDIGIDYVGEDNIWAVGLATGWRDGNLNVTQRASTADYDSWYVNGYARYGSGGEGATITGSAYFGEMDADVERTLAVNALTRNAMGRADIETIALAADARYGFDLGGNWALGPTVTILYADSDLSLDSETGAGSVALQSADASDGQTRAGAGLFANMQSKSASVDFTVQYVDGASDSVGARLAFAGGGNAPFTIFAPMSDPSGLFASASTRIDLGNGWSIGGEIQGLIGSDEESISGSAVLGWRF